MRSLTYFVATTLDGFIAGPDGGDPTSFWPITPDYVQHIVQCYPETLPGPAREAMGVTDAGHEFDTVVEGRRSYEVGTAQGVHDAYPHLRHLVVSTTLHELGDPAVELVANDPVAKIQELKRADGKGVWLVGGAALAHTLIDEIDRLILKVAPVTLGAGIPLWGSAAATSMRHWRLTDETVLSSGIRFSTYQPAD